MVRTYTHDEVVRWAQDAIGRASLRRNQQELEVQGVVREGVAELDLYDLNEAVEFLMSTYGQDFEITREDVDATRPRDSSSLERNLAMISGNNAQIITNANGNRGLLKKYAKRRKWLAEKIAEECIFGLIRKIPKPSDDERLLGLGEVQIDGVGSYHYMLYDHCYWMPIADGGKQCIETQEQINFVDEKNRIFDIYFNRKKSIWDKIYRRTFGDDCQIVLASAPSFDDDFERTYSSFEAPFPISRWHSGCIIDIPRFLDRVLLDTLEGDTQTKEKAKSLLNGIMHLPEVVIELQKRKQGVQTQERQSLQSRISEMDQLRP